MIIASAMQLIKKLSEADGIAWLLAPVSINTSFF
jgi:hypothetical protein